MKRWIICLLILLSPVASRAACTAPCVQNASVAINGSGNPSVAYPGANVAHHLLVAILSYGNSGGTEFMDDTNGNTWIGATGGGNGTGTAIYYVCDALAGANTVTYHYSVQFLSSLQIYEFSGNATSNCLDQIGQPGSSANDGTVNGTVSTNSAVTQANELVIAIFNGNHGSVSNITSNTGNTDELQTTTTPFYNSITRTAISNTTTGLSGVQTMTATADVAPTYWANAIATFKLAAPSGTVRHRVNQTRFIYCLPNPHPQPLLFARTDGVEKKMQLA